MIRLLAKLFLKDADLRSPKARTAYGTLCGLVGIGLNLLLFALKYFAGLLTGSVAIMADAFNNLSDSGSSVVTLLGFRIASRKPDPGHPFGHGRYEYLSGVAVSVAIIFMGIELGKSAVDKLMHPQVPQSDWLSIVILLAGIAVKLYMASYNHRYGKKLHSGAMEATAKDSLGDSISTALVLVSMLVLHLTGLNPDAWCGLLIALFVIYNGIRSAKETLDPLLGSAPDPEFLDQIRGIVREYPQIIGIHDLVVHDYGPGRTMISLHGEVSGKGDLFALHDMIDNLERRLATELSCEAVVHMDPIAVDDEKCQFLKRQVAEAIVKTVHPDMTIHDFRMVDGPTHTNLIFDLVVPNSCKEEESVIRSRTEAIVASLEGNCFAVITIDRDYTR